MRNDIDKKLCHFFMVNQSSLLAFKLHKIACFFSTVKTQVSNRLYYEQAGAELCQAQVKIEVIVVIGVKVEFEIVIEVGIQLLARVLGGRWVDGLKQK